MSNKTVALRLTAYSVARLGTRRDLNTETFVDAAEAANYRNLPNKVEEFYRQLPPGTEVGARRWPQHGPAPWVGILLAQDDPLAWRGSIAFPGGGLPDRKAIHEHVTWCKAQGLLDSHVPVAWDFGDRRRVVYWEAIEGDYAVISAPEDRFRFDVWTKRERLKGGA